LDEKVLDVLPRVDVVVVVVVVVTGEDTVLPLVLTVVTTVVMAAVLASVLDGVVVAMVVEVVGLAVTIQGSGQCMLRWVLRKSWKASKLDDALRPGYQ
jgi:hypothetical protein